MANMRLFRITSNYKSLWGQYHLFHHLLPPLRAKGGMSEVVFLVSLQRDTHLFIHENVLGS